MTTKQSVSWKESIEVDSKCPECGSTRSFQDYERGELICSKCGFVIDTNYIDERPDWREFDVESLTTGSGTGPPTTYRIHDKGLSTDISVQNRDSLGKSISSRNRVQLYRMRKWQKRMRASNTSERSLSYGLQEMERMASNLGVPYSVRETAAVIYRKTARQRVAVGRSIEDTIAGSIYAACRMANVPRTLEEIASTTELNANEIGRTYRMMNRHLKLNIIPPVPIGYVDMLCSRLNLSIRIKKRASEIIKMAQDQGITIGKRPSGVAAAAIYIAAYMSEERKTQRILAEAAGVTEVTVRTRCQELSQKLQFNRSKAT